MTTHTFRHVFTKAKRHNLRYGMGLHPTYKVAKTICRISHDVLEMIMDYITSEKITLSTAYGTYSIKNAQGQRVLISKVLRQSRNEELSRQIGN